MIVDKTCQDCSMTYKGHHASKWCPDCKPKHSKVAQAKAKRVNQPAIQPTVATEPPTTPQPSHAQPVQDAAHAEIDLTPTTEPTPPPGQPQAYPATYNRYVRMARL